MVLNSVAVIAACDAIGIPFESAIKPLRTFIAVPGRGSVTALRIDGGSAVVIDESYNANPLSMRAALAVVGGMPKEPWPGRRIAVLGDMLELGPDAPRLHAELATSIEHVGVDLVLMAGPNMRHLYDALPEAIRAKSTWKPTSADLEPVLLATVRAGDVVMIKGSNGSRMAPLVAALIARHSPAKSAS